MTFLLGTIVGAVLGVLGTLAVLWWMYRDTSGGGWSP